MQSRRSFQFFVLYQSGIFLTKRMKTNAIQYLFPLIRCLPRNIIVIVPTITKRIAAKAIVVIHVVGIGLLLLLILACALVISMMEPRQSPVPLHERILLNQRRILIAANYYNNENVLPVHLHNVLRLVDLIREIGGEVFISVYENGSKDSTPEILREYRHTLRQRNILHRVVMDSAPSWRQNFGRDNLEERIKFMAKIRNRVMEPLQEHAFDDVIFFNDVVFDPEDIIRLLLTERLHYDVACAMDFNRVTFYDTWVTRDLNGYSMMSFYPFVFDEESASLLGENRPLPVMSCWNGVIVAKAAALAKVKFRSWIENEPRSVHGDPSHVYSASCPVSECALLFKDLTENSHTRFFINPAVHVTYSTTDWLLHWLFGGLLNVLAEAFLEMETLPRIKESDRIPSCDIYKINKFRIWPRYFAAGILVGLFFWLVIRKTKLRRFHIRDYTKLSQIHITPSAKTHLKP